MKFEGLTVTRKQQKKSKTTDRVILLHPEAISPYPYIFPLGFSGLNITDQNRLLSDFNLPASDDISAVLERDKGKVGRTQYELADIFKEHIDEYREKHELSPEQCKAVSAIMRCRTEACGCHVDICNHCGLMDIQYNSCRDRHCPKCQGIAKRIWLRKRLDDLLPVDYHHATFTLPDEISHLSLYNKQLIYDLLFEASSQTLLVFGKDPQWLGAEVGFYGILHTWSQTLWAHLHIHYIVTAGGLTEDGEWIEPKYKGSFLFPVKAVAKVFRGKFIEGLKKLYYEGELTIPYDMPELKESNGFEKWLNRLCKTAWIVDSRPPFGGPEDVVRYIGRYTHRVAISNARILSMENGMVRFSYKDRKEKDPEKYWKEMTLPAEEFIRRFLMHILPKKYHRIRYYGFLSNGRKKDNIEKIRQQLNYSEETQEIVTSLFEENDGWTCPLCETGRMIPILIVDKNGKTIKSEYETAMEIFGYDTS